MAHLSLCIMLLLQLARGAAAAAGRRRAAAGGVAAFYGGSPVQAAATNTYLDLGSAKKRRSRRLFESGLHGVQEDGEQVCTSPASVSCDGSPVNTL